MTEIPAVPVPDIGYLCRSVPCLCPPGRGHKDPRWLAYEAEVEEAEGLPETDCGDTALHEPHDWLAAHLMTGGFGGTDYRYCPGRTASDLNGSPLPTWSEVGLDSARVPPQCCDLHGRTCEQGGEECCSSCTEAHHFAPAHGGAPCSNPDLSPKRGTR